jgi:hypothetical protein
VLPVAASSLPAVPHISFGIFNLAVPNIIAWVVVLLVFALAVGVRMPRLFEPAEPPEAAGSATGGTPKP